MTEIRELSAIMFTDIVGYTRLMGKDEAKALQALEQQRQLIKPLLAKHKGEMLKEIGDGTLSLFRSAVDAVDCALEIQRELQKNTDFYIRIGIHVGDVVFKDGDIFGDGVNVASRIEPLAEPGGICVSGSVYGYIRNQSNVHAVFLGEKELKNVAEPVKVYALTGEGLPTPKVLTEKPHRPFSRLTRNVALVLLGAVVTIFVLLNFVFNEPAVQKPSEIPEADKISLYPDQDKSVTAQPASEETRNRLAEGIALLEEELAAMDTEIAAMKKDLGTASRDGNEGLATVLAMVEEKEKLQQRLDELRGKWQQAVESDIAAYEKIILSSSGKDLEEAAWNKLVANYPEAAGLATGNVDLLKMLLFKEWVEPTTGMEFVWVEGGCFQMGDTFGEGDDDERPVHEVCVDSFGMSRHEVTQGQWQKIMGSNPSKFTKGDNYPVEQVSWVDTQDFIRKLNSLAGNSLRLPTEAEWEYAACSGGKKEKYAGGSDIDRLAWYDGNSGDSTHPVGTKDPNGLGLYDMSGNVWEWCSDWYDRDYYQQSLRNNPRGPSSGSFRVIRDGCWNGSFWLARCTNRDGFRPGYRLDNLGFRVVLPGK
jgi:formylglycine-generating enzyme required for sulfatase activity/class 3 adenylate cyclase